MADKPLGQTYYEEVEALKEGGMSNSDAIRSVAKKYNKKENAIRGGIHQYRARHLDGGNAAAPRRGRRPSTPVSVEDAVAGARRMLEQALEAVDRDSAAAKERLDAAQREYDELLASAQERKRDLEQKIKALS